MGIGALTFKGITNGVTITDAVNPYLTNKAKE